MAHPEATRRTIGLILYGVLMLMGAALLLLIFVLPALFGRNPEVDVTAMGVGALFALPPLAIYLWMPWIVDRYDPEPLWALMLCLFWGGIAACGFSAAINTAVGGVAEAVLGQGAGDAIGACISAPVVEEFWKGLAVFGMFYFARREFDGVVDGIIYATFAALGFAAIENVVYYGNAAKTEMLRNKDGILLGTFLVRGVLAPWGHPLYTSMTGIGFGVARETEKTWLRWCAPIFGYMGAMFLHCVWNTAATISGQLVVLMLPLWLLFVLAFFCLVVYLVVRKGRIIRQFLQDEILLGNMTKEEINIVCSPFGRMRASFTMGGKPGREFVDAAARLALSKWHTGRAQRGKKKTISADFVVPLRQDLHRLRAEMSRAIGRQLPQPQMWQAPPGQAHAPQGYVPPGGYPPYPPR